MTGDATERLLLRDSEGNYYLIPESALAGARVSDDRKQMLDDALGGDVRGYGTYPSAQLWRVAPTLALKLTLPDPGPEDYRVNPAIGVLRG